MRDVSSLIRKLNTLQGLDNGAFEMRSEQQQGSAANGADSAANSAMSAANGDVDQKWRKNYVPYQEAADATA